jgi:putative heme-binding domain-containing protein
MHIHHLTRVVIAALALACSFEDSALIRLLKSGRIPEERQPQIVSKIGQLGSAEDLAYLFDRSVDPKGFSIAVRVKALDALADAALTRKGLKPAGDLSRLDTLLIPETNPARIHAIRLAGLWKLEAAAPALSRIVSAKGADDETIVAGLDALAALGDAGRPAIEVMSALDRSKHHRMLGVAALTKINPEVSAAKAAELIRDAEKGQDFAPLVAAFLDRKEGATTLAKAIDAVKLPPDNAKLALRAMFALGRADAPLMESLSKAAGIDSDTKPPTKEEMDRLVADVTAKGDAARGERVLRRPELNCMKCHSIAGAAGGVGPDLSSVGLSAPIDYVINSILVPDQAIKEQYHTLVIATTDGQIFQGIVADKDETKVVLKQANGELKIVPTSDIEESKEGGSLMPKGLANLLTRDDFLDLVRFISELGKPGPYAIHTTPTIQRWRLLKPVPEELSNSTPDAGAFVAKVRDSDPARWVPAYGLSTGEIPVDEFVALAESKVLYLKGEIDVSAPGNLDVDLGSTNGVSVWFDEKLVDSAGTTKTWDVGAGKHTITLRVDANHSKLAPIVVKLAKAPGSAAEFVVVGGR